MLAALALRSVAGGATAVLLGESLRQRGASAAATGVVLTAILIGNLVAIRLVGRFADHRGRRRVSVVLHIMLALSAVVFAVSPALWPLVLAGLAGAVLPDAADRGAFAVLDQVMLAAVLPARSRLRSFGAYTTVGAVAGGAGALLGGGLPAVVALGGHPVALRWWLLLVVPCALAGAALVAGVSPRVERAANPGSPPPRVAPEAVAGRPGQPAVGNSRRVVRQLAALFAVDAFAGGLVVQAFIAYWLARRFSAGTALVGGVFVAVQLGQAVSYTLAVHLAERIGLLATMVVSHLPSNVLLAAVAFAPSLPVAIALLVGRSLLSQMDVPTRQAYVLALVEPAEHTYAVTTTASARQAAKPFAPLTGGAMTALGLGLGAPFLIAGAAKAAYDLALWQRFRHTYLPPEVARPVRRPAADPAGRGA